MHYRWKKIINEQLCLCALDCLLGVSSCKTNSENQKNVFQESYANGNWMVWLQLCWGTEHKDFWVSLQVKELSLLQKELHLIHCFFFYPLSSHSDINKINNAIADQVSIFIERISTFVFGFMVGFIGGWKLTLVVIAVSPLIGIAAGLMAMVVKWQCFTTRK